MNKKRVLLGIAVVVALAFLQSALLNTLPESARTISPGLKNALTGILLASLVLPGLIAGFGPEKSPVLAGGVTGFVGALLAHSVPYISFGFLSVLPSLLLGALLQAIPYAVAGLIFGGFSAYLHLKYRSN